MKRSQPIRAKMRAPRAFAAPFRARLVIMAKVPVAGNVKTRLSRQVGVSEAALYRHFPSKARMFEGLIEFVEESVFSRVPRIGANTELGAAERPIL